MTFKRYAFLRLDNTIKLIRLELNNQTAGD